MFPNREHFDIIPRREQKLVELRGVGRLEEFKAEHSDARAQVDSWIAEMREGNWQSTRELKHRYVSASVISGSRVVFNLKGNRYRLDALIDFQRQIVLVVRVGTHKEYDSWKF